MIRPARPEDVAQLLPLAERTGMFQPHELEALRELLDDYFAALQQWGHRARVWESAGLPLGLVYYAPAPLTDRTWYLYWIVVERTRQRQGVGGRLLQWVENDLRLQRARLLLIETSSRPEYAPTRAFYQKHGYHPCAVVPDFYADGDSMVVFSRRL